MSAFFLKNEYVLNLCRYRFAIYVECFFSVIVRKKTNREIIRLGYINYTEEAIRRLVTTIEKILNKAKDFFKEYPEYSYLIAGMVSLVLFIGVLKDKNWAIDPDSGNQRMFYNNFGHKRFRLLLNR